METREAITLDVRAQQRLMVLAHVLAGELGYEDAAAVLRVSGRQLKRLLHRYRAEGAAAFVPGNRGRRPVNRIDDAVRAQIAELATTTFETKRPACTTANAARGWPRARHQPVR